jgi:transposase
MSNMGRPKTELVLSEAEHAALEQMRRRRSIGAAMAQRAAIVLLCAEGRDNCDVAEELSITDATVGKWRRRFTAHRMDGLYDEPRVGRPRTTTDEDVQRIVDTTLHDKPRASTHWSSRILAKQLNVSCDAVQRVWHAFGLQPSRTESFSLSKDPQFIEKIRDVVGLYMSPPDNAVVLCVDEKSQMQALDRSQPLLPMLSTHPERRTPTYARHGTTSLFAALDVATGRVVGKTYRRHRAAEFLRFLGEIDSHVPPDLDVHLVMDNYATHKTEPIKRWLLRHPRYHVHFTPTSSSWLNLVESFFSLVERNVTRRGVHRNVRSLEVSVRAFLDAHNEGPRPFIWTKTADQILDSLRRYCADANVVRERRLHREMTRTFAATH